jgi:hypothetical protein
MTEIPTFRRVIVDSLPPLLRRTAEILEQEGRIVVVEDGTYEIAGSG